MPDWPGPAADPLAEAGVTWWQEAVDPREGDLDRWRGKVRRGPPAP